MAQDNLAKRYVIQHCPSNQELAELYLDMPRGRRTVPIMYTTETAGLHDSELRVVEVIIELLLPKADCSFLEITGFVKRLITHRFVATFEDGERPFRASRPMLNILNTNWIEHDIAS